MDTKERAARGFDMGDLERPENAWLRRSVSDQQWVRVCAPRWIYHGALREAAVNARRNRGGNRFGACVETLAYRAREALAVRKAWNVALRNDDPTIRWCADSSRVRSALGIAR